MAPRATPGRSSFSERAFTTETPTPCRPPEIRYPSPPNLPPAFRVVRTTSTAGRRSLALGMGLRDAAAVVDRPRPRRPSAADDDPVAVARPSPRRSSCRRPRRRGGAARGCSVVPMYIPGRRRTCSTPSRTWISAILVRFVGFPFRSLRCQLSLRLEREPRRTRNDASLGADGGRGARPQILSTGGDIDAFRAQPRLVTVLNPCATSLSVARPGRPSAPCTRSPPKARSARLADLFGQESDLRAPGSGARGDHQHAAVEAHGGGLGGQAAPDHRGPIRRELADRHARARTPVPRINPSRTSPIAGRASVRSSLRCCHALRVAASGHAPRRRRGPRRPTIATTAVERLRGRAPRRRRRRTPVPGPVSRSASRR